jgi:hypothetical protein
MNNKKNRILLGLIITFSTFNLQPSTAYALLLHPSAGSTAASFLKIGVGPRAIAMGEAFCAVADDASAIYWNPAGLTNIENHQLYFMHDEWLQSVKHDFIAYAQALNANKAFGLAADSVFVYGMEKRPDETLNDLTDPQNLFDSLDLAGIISYSQKLTPGIAIGANLKIINQRIDADSAWGFAFDVGGLHNIRKNMKLGWNIQNIGMPITFLSKGYQMPLNLKIGVSYNMDKYNTLIAFDVNQPIDNYLSASAGVEYTYKMIALRAGYKYKLGGNDLGPLSGLSAGFGLKINNIEGDYAFVPYSELESYTHKISLLVKF